MYNYSIWILELWSGLSVISVFLVQFHNGEVWKLDKSEIWTIPQPDLFYYQNLFEYQFSAVFWYDYYQVC